MTQITLKGKSRVEWLDWCIANDSWLMMIHVSGWCSFGAYLESPRFGDNDQLLLGYIPESRGFCFCVGAWDGYYPPTYFPVTWSGRRFTRPNLPQREAKTKITHYEAPQTFWNYPFSPPKMTFDNGWFGKLFVGPPKTCPTSNLSNCALALKALMDFASTCTCLRMRQRSCGGGRRNVENIWRSGSIWWLVNVLFIQIHFFSRSLHNRNSWQPMRVVLLKVKFLNQKPIPFTPSRHSQFPSSNFKGCIFLYLFFRGLRFFSSSVDFRFQKGGGFNRVDRGHVDPRVDSLAVWEIWRIQITVFFANHVSRNPIFFQVFEGTKRNSGPAKWLTWFMMIDNTFKKYLLLNMRDGNQSCFFSIRL